MTMANLADESSPAFQAMPLFLRYRTALLAVSAAIMLYALVGFWGVPYAAKTFGVPALSQRLQHPVLLGDLAFNPFTFSLRVSQFEIQQQDGRPLLGFGELFVDFEVTSLVRSSYLFDEIRLTFPYSFVHVPATGKLNLVGLVSRQVRRIPDLILSRRLPMSRANHRDGLR